MKRTLMQLYLKNSAEAAAMYCEAFNAPIAVYGTFDDGNYMHAEIDVQGQIIAVSEATEPAVTGTTMQFCLHYGKGNEAMVQRAYDALCEGGTISFPLGECSFSPLMADITDKFGVRWCLFV